MTDETTNDQIIEPSANAEDMNAFIKSLEGSYGDNINLSTFLPQGHADEPNGDDEETPGEGDEETPGTDDTTDQFVTINGHQVPIADVQRLYEFDQYLRSNPDVAQRMAEAAKPAPTGQPSVSQTPTPTEPANEEFKPPEPPAELDLEDPRDKVIWDTHVATQKASWENRQALIQMQNQYNNDKQLAGQRKANEDMEVALDQFRTQFKNLNDDDIARIRQDAGPFVAGMIETHGQTPQALYKAMEVAGYSNAETRLRMAGEETRQPTTRQRSETRKRKLGSISGTPTSAPKDAARPVYRNDRDMVQQFADALAEQGMGR